MYEQTSGNPFFVSEVVGLLRAEGQLLEPAHGGDSPFPLPHGVRETIRRRLRQRSDACIRLLEVTAVIGREFSLDLLSRVSGEESPTGWRLVFNLVDEALAARLVDEVADGVGHYRFTHALVRETLYEDLALTDRTPLHAQLGEALEALHAANLDPHLTELADHFFKAIPAGGDVEKGIAYGLKAGAYATARLAYAEAALQYKRALQALDLTEPDLTRRGNLLLALGETQMKAGDTAQARTTLLRAADLARQLGRQAALQDGPSLLARAALGLSGVWVGTGIGVVDQPLVSLLEEARVALGEEDSILRVRVLARLAAELRWSVPREQRAPLSHQAVEMARRIGDRATLAYALAAEYWALWGPENLANRTDTARESVLLAEADGDKALALVGHTWHLTALLELGDIPAVDQEIARVMQLTDEIRQPLYQW